MKAMLRNVWRGSQVTELWSKTSRIVKLPAVRTSAPAVDGGRELHGVRCLRDAGAAELERLPQVRARSIELGRLGAGLLQLEVLDRAADSA